MAGGWQNSNRRSQLPSNWASIRRRVFRRDGGQCVIIEHGIRCPEDATDCDHIVPGNDHSEANLRSLCKRHHLEKSSREGGAARQAKRRAINNRLARTERHPGLL